MAKDDKSPGERRRGQGRPSDYRPEYVDQARRLCKLGLTNHELAEFFGCDPRTMTRWRHEHPEFDKAIRRGKKVADDAVEESLFKMATGYSYDAVKIMQHEGDVIEAPYVEFVPADPRAAIFWLWNRRGAKWKQQQQPNNAETNQALAAALMHLADRLPV